MILNISEAANKARVSRSTLYKMKLKGDISFSLTTNGKPGIEERKLVRVFPDCFKNNIPRQLNTEDLSQEVLRLNALLQEQKDRELAELGIRAERAEARVDELIKVTQCQSNQLLLTHKKTWIKRLFKVQ